ncbi:hypothetical protein BEL04_20360 [Mucilaginibacter sp. PPCGB 2223]|nr:hypothetical protein BEL04_20360 [Mucilaginibacter sp. PPCGB 2223]
MGIHIAVLSIQSIIIVACPYGSGYPLILHMALATACPRSTTRPVYTPIPNANSVFGKNIGSNPVGKQLRAKAVRKKQALSAGRVLTDLDMRAGYEQRIKSCTSPCFLIALQGKAPCGK